VNKFLIILLCIVFVGSITLCYSDTKEGRILRVNREYTNYGYFFTVKYDLYANFSEEVRVTIYCYFIPSGEGEYERVLAPIKYNIKKGIHETELFLSHEEGRLNNFKANLYINDILVDTWSWR